MAGHNVLLVELRYTLVLVACVIAVSKGVRAEDGIKDLIATCAACHGENGIPQDKMTPVIWGQNEGYMYLQLRDFQKGTRENEQMQPIVDDLKRETLKALAAHFTERRWPDVGRPPAPPTVAKRAANSVARSDVFVVLGVARC